MLTYIEDFIEFLFGSMDANGAPTNRSLYSPVSPINLASYDRNPITSMANFCVRARINKLETCLTDRQHELARKIIFKYRRQFLATGITLPENEELPSRHGIRPIDRSRHLKYDPDEKTIELKFPYDPRKITDLHDHATKSAGRFAWSNSAKLWSADLTEGNLALILKLFKDEDLKVDELLEPILTDMLKASPTDLPSFEVRDNMMVLPNCHPRVAEYLESKGWRAGDIENLAYWTSHAASMELRIDSSVDAILLQKYSELAVSIIKTRKIALPSNNQATGPWYDALLEANSALSQSVWLLNLTWWSDKTSWSTFKNMQELADLKSRNSFKVEQNVADIFYENANNNPIVVVDSIIGKDSIRNFIENNATKVIYISDIGGTS